MKFTGERYVPSEKGIIRYEHLHRYAIARSLAAGKTVLDIASGEGYGSAMLAEVAREVVGVDIDVGAIAHATREYKDHANARFVTGSCDAVPLPDESFDLIVSFETIEHHNRHEEMMREIKRLLKPHGVLVLSSPNRPVYDNKLLTPNLFHAKELDRHELVNLLERHFRSVRAFGQQVLVSSFVFDLDRDSSPHSDSYVSQKGHIAEQLPRFNDPTYFVVACSDSVESLPHTLVSFFVDRQDDVISQLRAQWLESARIVNEHDQKIRIYKERITSLHSEVNWMKGLKFWKLAVAYWGWRARVREMYESFRAWLRIVIPYNARRFVVRALRRFSLMPPDPALATFETVTPPQNFSQVKYDVIAFSIIDWEFRYQRPQQITSQFAAQGHRVFYVSLSRFLPRHHSHKYALRVIKENLYEVSLAVDPPPDVSRHEIDGDSLTSLMESLATLRHEQRIEEALCYVMLPSWGEAAIAARARWGWRILYDCMDDWEHFPDFPQAVIAAEPKLIQATDLVLVAAQPLYDKWNRFETPILTVRNGVDTEFYRQRLQPNERLSNFSHPVIGYFGAVAAWLDLELIRYLAINRPHYTFIFLGGIFVDISSLNAFPNVHFLGQQPYETMPQYLYHFDVCLIPFRVNALTKAVDPVKIYEYFVGGKPVVCSKMPEVERFGDAVYIGRDPDHFLRQLDLAIAENDPHRVQLRRTIAEQNSWERRYRQIHQALISLTPRASIIVVTHNNLKFTQDCLESLFNHTDYLNYEVIVVDNASTDGTPDYLQELFTHQSNLVLLFNDHNLGFAKANNLGLQRASGDFLILLNNDTLLPPGWLSRLLRHLHDPKCGLVGPVTNSVGNEAKTDVSYTEQDQIAGFAKNDTWAHDGEAADISMLAMFCVAMRRDVYDAVGPLDERFGIGMFEDDDYTLRVKQKGYRVRCARDVFVHHHGQATFRQLIEDGSYDALFNENRRRFEEKWKTEWKPHNHALLPFAPHKVSAVLPSALRESLAASPSFSFNTRAWVDRQFKVAWEQNTGNAQTRYFMQALVAHLPLRERAYLNDHALSILDWGCALGDGVDELQLTFPHSTITGLDFSSEAIRQACQRYSSREFVHSDFIPREFDVIITSNCLEHFDHPLAVVAMHLESCGKLYIALVPHQESPLIASHFSRFDLDTFPQRIGQWRRLYAQPIKTDAKFWDGEQLLVIYASELYLHEQGAIEVIKSFTSPAHLKKLKRESAHLQIETSASITPTPPTPAAAPSVSESEINKALPLLHRLAASDSSTRAKLQKQGIDVSPMNFYSALPSVEEIHTSFEYADLHTVPYLDDRLFDKSTLDRELDRLTEYAAEFDPPREGDVYHPARFFWNNGMFSHSDALAHYCFIRAHRPQTIVEVGSGFSTLIALDALERNGGGRMICIEPHPPKFIESNPRLTLIRQPAQVVSADTFNSYLHDGDFLFIDSTHTVKTGSDCAHLYLRVLPHIRHNILVHAHDVFLPFGLPRDWLLDHHAYWTEQYLVMALLIDNPKTKVLYGSAYHEAFNKEALMRMMDGKWTTGGGSFWFEYNG